MVPNRSHLPPLQCRKLASQGMARAVLLFQACKSSPSQTLNNMQEIPSRFTDTTEKGIKRKKGRGVCACSSLWHHKQNPGVSLRQIYCCDTQQEWDKHHSKPRSQQRAVWRGMTSPHPQIRTAISSGSPSRTVNDRPHSSLSSNSLNLKKTYWPKKSHIYLYGNCWIMHCEGSCQKLWCGDIVTEVL